MRFKPIGKGVLTPFPGFDLSNHAVNDVATNNTNQDTIFFWYQSSYTRYLSSYARYQLSYV
ncbi:MAG TPA: hypothetical protein VF721_09030, partial [Pyrinomonadaceae bacterium]